MIWRNTFSSGGVVLPFPNPMEYYEDWEVSFGVESNDLSDLPVTLRVNKESREETLKPYSLILRKKLLPKC